MSWDNHLTIIKKTWWPSSYFLTTGVGHLCPPLVLRVFKQTNIESYKLAQNIVPETIFTTTIIDGKIVRRQTSFWLIHFFGKIYVLEKLRVAIIRQAFRYDWLMGYLSLFNTNYFCRKLEDKISFLKTEFRARRFSYHRKDP